MSGPVQVDGALMPVRILQWEPRPRRRWRGDVTVQVGDLRLLRCPVFRVNGALRVVLPARARFGPDGQHLLDPGTGRHLYEPIVQWATKAAATQFSDAVIAALTAKHPEIAQ